MRRPIPSFAVIVVACVLVTWLPLAGAQVYKCTDATGRTSYGDAPCAQGQKPLAIPNDPAPLGASAPAKGAGAPAGGTPPHVCAQMLDELNRLAAIRERTGSAPTSRAKSLTRQYEARCVGISRAGPPAR
jgi:hypothetical protein